MLRRTVQTCLLAVVLALSTIAPSSAAFVPVEPYAHYVPQTICSPKARPGTQVFASWVVSRYGGGWGGISRACHVGGRSEHKEGRAFDWTLDATRAVDRQRAARFLERILRTNSYGDHAAWARRMGVMYIIWNDRMYPAYDRFRPRPYLSSGCSRLARCSKTLRHRDHLHISLNWRGARGDTSWYAGRMG